MAVKRRNAVMRLPMRVWDAPIRLFHWAVTLLVLVSYVSIKTDHVQLHLLSGYTMLTLLVFRLAWGFVGSDTARFTTFLRSPTAGLRHLGQFRDRAPDDEIGHNAAGGWMVLLLLCCLLVQVSTGLFANDGGGTEGALAKYVSSDRSDLISAIHGWNFDVLLALIALHVLAIAAYAMLRGHDLLRPMITGKKRLPAATRAPRMGSPLLAALLLALIATAVWIVATRV